MTPDACLIDLLKSLFDTPDALHTFVQSRKWGSSLMEKLNSPSQGWELYAEGLVQKAGMMGSLSDDFFQALAAKYPDRHNEIAKVAAARTVSLPPKVPADLRKRLDDGKVLFIVGAGVSIGATNGAALSWKGLLEDGIRRCLEKGGANEKWARRRREDLEEDDIGEWLSVAGLITDKLGGDKDGRYLDWLEETVGSLELTNPKVIKALDDLNCPIATTNYDSLLSMGCSDRPPVPWNDARKVARWQEGLPGILHLHGHWEVGASVVLGDKSYWKIAADERAQIIQKALTMQHALVFVGCGETTNDPNLGKMLDWMATELSASSINHYRLCRYVEVDALKAKHPPSSRIFPLPYGPSHSDLGPWLRRLRSPALASPTLEDD